MKMHKTHIDIPEEKRVTLCQILSRTLASTADLKLQLKHAHWNIKGMEFIALHKLFDELVEVVEEQSDTVGERITTLGGTANGTIQGIVNHSLLNTMPAEIFDARDILHKLVENFAILAQHTRENIRKTEELGDIATGDLYIQLTRELDKKRWFLEAHLQN